MRVLYSLIGALLLASAAAPIPDPKRAAAPCGSEMCQLNLGDEARRLNDAYFSDATTDAERAKMHSIITSNTSSGQTNWKSAAAQYFAWIKAEPAEMRQVGVKQAEQKIAARITDANVDFDKVQLDLQRRLKIAGEAAVKAQLVDPNSAEFEWPYGFILGTWKPFLAKRVTGYWTCGRVNARNRMGGYAGSAVFVVVLSEDGDARFVDIAEGKYPLVETQCSKSASLLPPGRPDVATAAGTPAALVADELEKLASLRDRGIITAAEFEAQKAKLLGEQ